LNCDETEFKLAGGNPGFMNTPAAFQVDEMPLV
jgi:hypothetical protein